MRPIDADALKNHLEDLRSYTILGEKHPYYSGETNALSVVIQNIENAPTVDAVPVKHGRWVKMTGMMPPECRGHYECSECRWHIRGPRDSCRKEEEQSYCPNCGAKMDGERRESDG